MDSKLQNAITFTPSSSPSCTTEWKGEQVENYWGRPVRTTEIKIYRAHVGYIVENLQTEQEWDNDAPYVDRFEIHINHMHDPKKYATHYASTYQEAVNFAREALGFPVDEAAQGMEAIAPEGKHDRALHQQRKQIAGWTLENGVLSTVHTPGNCTRYDLQMSPVASQFATDSDQYELTLRNWKGRPTMLVNLKYEMYTETIAEHLRINMADAEAVRDAYMALFEHYAQNPDGLPSVQALDDARDLGWDLADIAVQFQRMVAYLALHDDSGCQDDEGPAADVVIKDPRGALQSARVELNRLKMIIRDQRQLIRDLEGK